MFVWLSHIHRCQRDANLAVQPDTFGRWQRVVERLTHEGMDESVAPQHGWGLCDQMRMHCLAECVKEGLARDHADIAEHPQRELASDDRGHLQQLVAWP